MPADDNGQRNPLPRLTIYRYTYEIYRVCFEKKMKLKSVTSDYIHEKEASR